MQVDGVLAVDVGDLDLLAVDLPPLRDLLTVDGARAGLDARQFLGQWDEGGDEVLVRAVSDGGEECGGLWALDR